jgi:phage tail sheath gpL-like
MTSDHAALIACMERAIEAVRELPETTLVHTITVTLDGRSQTNVSATIDYDVDDGECLERGMVPLVIT